MSIFLTHLSLLELMLNYSYISMENKHANKSRNVYLAIIFLPILAYYSQTRYPLVSLWFLVLLKKINILKKSSGTNHCLPDEINFISLAEKAFYYDPIPQKANQRILCMLYIR